MNDVLKQKKDTVLKSLAIAGFIGIIILIAWLSVQLISIVPGAFSSLASLAETINQRGQTETVEKVPLLVTSNTTLANSGEMVTVTWNTAKAPGSYTFSYTCSEGIAVDLVNVEGIKSIGCGTNYNLGDTDSLTMTVDSEKDRFADLEYTVSFLGTNDTEPRASGTVTLTVINTNLKETTTTEEDETSVTEETPDVATEAEVDTDSTTPAVQPTTPAYEQQYVYTIPTSDPNGRTDLGVRFLNVGEIVGNVFFTKPLERNEDGAIQFEVKNYGSKTSKDWTFAVTLPNGSTYRSDEQKPLKPNERAVLTIGFGAANVSSHNFIVIVDEPTDQVPLNDRFSFEVNYPAAS